MRIARVAAQAKVNLTLVVGPSDESGYHRLFTIFQRLELADDVTVRADTTGRSLDCSGPRMPAGGLGPVERNLAYRAAVAYAERTGWPTGFAIELVKHVPAAGGLGGGSADAGAVLRALDAIAPTPAGADTLAEIARGIGSDVPFLASELVLAGAAGRGEILYPEDPLPSRTAVLVVPAFGVATGEAYGWLDAARAGSTAEPPAVAEMEAGTWDDIVAGSLNHFEAVVEQRHPELRRHRERLAASGAFLARLSGSGSTVFGLFEGAPPGPATQAPDALTIVTRTSERVVQVEVLE